MKSLRQYLTESVRTYHYTIKIVGDCDSKFLDMFVYNLSKFDPVKVGDPKTTPIQKAPYGFPDADPNQSITIIKCEFKYPATEPMVQQCAQACGCQINRVRMIDTAYDDSITAENEKYANEASHSPLLTHEELEDGGKEASKEYANQYLDRVMPKKPSIDIPYDAKKTPTEPNRSKEGINTMSPMSRMTRPQKPATGASSSK